MQHPGALLVGFTVLLLIGAIVAFAGEPRSDTRASGGGLVVTAFIGYVLTVLFGYIL